MSEANCGISVHEVTQVRVSDSEGNAMNQGDTIVLRIDTEDILCVFKGIESGYFITETCEDGMTTRKQHQWKQLRKSALTDSCRQATSRTESCHLTKPQRRAVTTAALQNWR